MIDTTKILLPDNQIDAIVSAIKDQPKDILTSGEIALIASAIGVVAAIVPQLIVHILERRKERKKLKKELIAEERRITYLLQETHKELVHYWVGSQYWYRIHNFEYDSEVEMRLSKFRKLAKVNSYEKYISSDQNALMVKNKIRVLMADYCKTVSHFLLIANCERSDTPKWLTKIQTIEIRRPSDFFEVEKLDDLYAAFTNEREAMCKEFQIYNPLFDKINEEMKKQL